MSDPYTWRIRVNVREERMNKLSGSQILMESLLAQGVDVVFGYPGGAIMPSYDALYDYRDRIRHVLVRHEQGAAHAAEGYARATSRPGVCVVTSGPGATNLVTGIADAMMDSIPLVCITGQVTKMFLGTDAFQETDVMGITIPITKWSYQITEASEIPLIISKAFHIASSGRPGPVVVDITKNAQTERIEYVPARYHAPRAKRAALDPAKLKEASELINNASRPYILAGHGVLISGAVQELQACAEKAGIPVGVTLHGLSAFSATHPLYTGMLGMHGNYGPNVLTNRADLLIAVGMRFDDRVTGDLSTYATKCQVVHIDIDPAELGKNVRPTVGIAGDAREVLTHLLPLLEERRHELWLQEFKKCDAREYEKVIRDATKPSSGPLKMSEVVRVLSEKTKGEAVIVADVGQHQMMAARYYQFSTPDSWITSGGLGTMGFALPAAIGAKIGAPDRTVITVVGDGGFQMTCQELGTIAQEDLNVKIVILNNSFLGMVRQWQELFFDTRYSFVELKNPDFVKLSSAFGIPASRVSVREDLEGALHTMLSTRGAYLLEVVVEAEQNVFPMVPTGASVSDIRLE
jgi:acetolactate synthase I/II/III large subunit